MRLITGIAVMALAVSGAGCSGQDVGEGCPAEGCALQEMRTLSYSSPASVLRTMEVAVPDQGGSWPVVIVAHGGGQKRRAVRDWATGIAARGAMAYNVDWPAGGVGNQESAERLACAVRVAVDDAAEHGGDTSRVVFVGHSLGAAVGAAVSLGGSAASEDCAVADGDPLPDAFVGYEGPYDIATVDYENGRVPRIPPGDEAVDPYAQIGGNPDLVVRLLHGDAEDIAWFDTPMFVSEQLATALDDAGYDVELIVVEGGEHDAGKIVEGTPAQRAIVDQVTDLLSTL
jgi:acetyl esterase/lipase